MNLSETLLSKQTRHLLIHLRNFFRTKKSLKILVPRLKNSFKWMPRNIKVCDLNCSKYILKETMTWSLVLSVHPWLVIQILILIQNTYTYFLEKIATILIQWYIQINNGFELFLSLQSRAQQSMSRYSKVQKDKTELKCHTD